MSLRYREAIADYIRTQAQPVDKYSHQPRLYALARTIGEGLAYDDDVLFAAAWLHDLGVFFGHRPEDVEALSRWDHLGYVLDKAPALLAQFGFPEAKVPATLSAIRSHMPSGRPDCIEGWILRDADILEQMGAVGILRLTSKVGRDTRYPTLGSVIPALRHNLTKLPTLLRTARARELSQDRRQLLEDFLRAAESESQGIPL